MAKQRLEVWSIRNAKTTTGDRSFWTRCGVAFVNRDGSINVKLELMPLDGELHIREPKPKEKRTDAPTPDEVDA
jgi:hypothetical protein